MSILRTEEGTDRLVSVVILNWRHEDDTLTCVESVRKLKSDRAIEIIVVDNESTPLSRSRLASDDVSLVPSDRNLGFAGGMNLGVRHAHGTYVAILNNDLVVDPRWLHHGALVMDCEPDVALVGGKSYLWDEEHPPFRTDSPATTYTFVDPNYGSGSLQWAPVPKSDVAALDGGNLLVRRELWDQVGGFDDRYFAYGEDIDLCARLLAQGGRLVYEPAMAVWHRRNVSSDAVGWRRAFWSKRNQLMTIAKHFPDQTWWRRVFRVGLEAAWFGAAGRPAGVRRRHGTRRLTSAERTGYAFAAAWMFARVPYLSRVRRATVRAGQHDERYLAALLDRNPPGQVPSGVR